MCRHFFLFLIGCFWSVCSYAYFDAYYTTIGPYTYTKTKQPFSSDNAGYFTLLVSSDGLVYYKVAAKVSQLDEQGNFKVIGESSKQIGEGSCRKKDFHRIEYDYGADDVLVCEMTFTDKYKRNIYLRKILNSASKALLVTDGKMKKKLDRGGEMIISWEGTITDKTWSYVYDCFPERNYDGCTGRDDEWEDDEWPDD